MYQGNKRCDLFDLVGLKVTNKMPFNIVWASGLFFTKFLNPALSKNSLASFIGFQNGFFRVKL